MRAQALRLTTVKSPVYVPDVIKALQERYGFVQVPTTAEAILPRDTSTTPIVLGHGKFMHEGRPIIIQSLRLFANGITVETSISTDDADIVADDILHLGETFVTPISTPKFYVSQLEVILDHGIEPLAPAGERIAYTLESMLENYGHEALPPFHLIALGMNVDPSKAMTPADFRLERRLGVPYEANVYFSQAPLRTPDHLAALEEIEEILRENADSAKR
jgi:hypothetical protein